MPGLYFYYSCMNAGKSTNLLQSNFNYLERGMNTLLFIPEVVGVDYISSRIGLKEKAYSISKKFHFFNFVKQINKTSKIDCILIDEAQFLTREQVLELGEIVDNLEIPILCYGLRSDFKEDVFEGSQYLLALADKLIELKTICSCGKKATRNLKMNPENFKSITDGNQIEIGGNKKYISLCRKCYKNRIKNKL